MRINACISRERGQRKERDRIERNIRRSGGQRGTKRKKSGFDCSVGAFLSVEIWPFCANQMAFMARCSPELSAIIRPKFGSFLFYLYYCTYAVESDSEFFCMIFMIDIQEDKYAATNIDSSSPKAIFPHKKCCYTLKFS